MGPDGEMMIEELFNQHRFDPTQPHQVLIVEHTDSSHQVRVAPLIIITTEDGYRVSRAVFTDEGLKPGLSASFAPNGQLIGGTNDLGSPSDRRQARRAIDELIARREHLEGDAGVGCLEIAEHIVAPGGRDQRGDIAPPTHDVKRLALDQHGDGARAGRAHLRFEGREARSNPRSQLSAGFGPLRQLTEPLVPNCPFRNKARMLGAVRFLLSVRHSTITGTWCGAYPS